MNYKFNPSYHIPIHKKCALEYEFFYKEFSYINPEGKIDNDIIDVNSDILTAKSCIYKFSVKYDDIIYEWVQKSQNTISNLKKTLLRKILESLKLKLDMEISISFSVKRKLNKILILKTNIQ